MLRPGGEIVQSLGGLHGFMHWQRPILTDSGGFQVWSLETRNKVSEDGVEFRAPTDGSLVFLSPERAMEVQAQLGSDIQMIFDECTDYPATEAQARDSMELSLRWALRSRQAFDAGPAPARGSAIFGIIQGGMHESLRSESLDGLAWHRLRRAGDRRPVRRASPRKTGCASWSTRCRGCPPASRATSWAWAPRPTSSRRCSGGWTCSIA